jgi:hypothetical protein
MDMFEIVFISTIVVSILCISFSTWMTLSDLRAAMLEEEGLEKSTANDERLNIAQLRGSRDQSGLHVEDKG